MISLPETDPGQRRRAGVRGPPRLQLEEREGDRGEDDVVVPPAERAAFEMVPAEFVLEVSVVKHEHRNPAVPMRAGDDLWGTSSRSRQDAVAWHCYFTAVPRAAQALTLREIDPFAAIGRRSLMPTRKRSLAASLSDMA